MMVNSKIKLINFLVSLRRLPPLSELSGEEERMLFELYALAQEKDPILVTDVYGLSGFGSRSTGYRTLVALREKGVVEFEANDPDRRKRHVRFTETADNIFKAFQ
jgi:DNA-binding MarR family transcriptional regulator